MPHEKLQLWERLDFERHFKADGYQLLDDEAQDMDHGIDIEQCISRPDGIHISAGYGGERYELHFNPQNPESGSYVVSAGAFGGNGRVVSVREVPSPSFKHYFYVKVVSSGRAHHFAWRIAFDEFTAVVTEEV